MHDELIKRLRKCASYDPRFVIQDCEEAADAIEDLEKCLTIALLEYQRANNKLLMTEEYVKQKLQWIPITERLPENRNMVLATVDGVVCVAFYGNYMWEEVETYSIFYPTHWMPFPEPPKEG